MIIIKQKNAPKATRIRPVDLFFCPQFVHSSEFFANHIAHKEKYKQKEKTPETLINKAFQAFFGPSDRT